MSSPESTSPLSEELDASLREMRDRAGERITAVLQRAADVQDYFDAQSGNEEHEDKKG